ncbi:LysR substrate-binding domain-containing protein [Coralliovum pocilloporae]|uniref:LysR substrate-binding domain-containing protein n=1 Tax=Coralliovum pocilloporae TaxID=3066369 RepID=UPI003306E076
MGEQLMTHTHMLLNLHDSALSDLTGTGLSGTICIGCPEDYLDIFMPQILERFTVMHSDIELEIKSAPTNELRAMLDRRTIDVAIVSDPIQAREPEPLRKSRLVWVCKEPSPDILKSSVVPLALSAKNTLDHRIAAEAMRQAGIPYRIAFASNSLNGLISIARSGAAISVITVDAVPDDLELVEELLPQLPEIKISIELSGAPKRRAVSEFHRVAMDVISDT